MIKNQNKKLSCLLLFTFLAMVAVGCKKKEAPPPQPVPESKPVASQVAPVQKQMSSVQTITGAGSPFDFNYKKDPFKPYVVETKAPTPKTGAPRIGGLPIQNYEVNQFRVLGIITGLKQDSALVVDPAGKSYVVKPGMEIGKNNGRIVKITTTTIEVFEQFRDEEGKLRKRTVKLTLPKKE
jgi:type IV pilus assembly protein PilP